jgi:hypothetical protein
MSGELRVNRITDEAGTGSPEFPNGASLTSAATASTDAVRFDQVIGLGQTWQDVTASRAVGTTYTNTTGRPIFINIRADSNNSTVPVLQVDGLDILSVFVDFSSTSGVPLTAIVPPGATYRLFSGVGSTSITIWSELR